MDKWPDNNMVRQNFSIIKAINKLNRGCIVKELIFLFIDLHTCPEALSAFIALWREKYLFAATAPKMAAPNRTDSLSLGKIIGHPTHKQNNMH